jgi:hypothetical protein
MDIDGITVTGDPYPGEIEGYVRRGLREHGKVYRLAIEMARAQIDLTGEDETKSVEVEG